MHATHTVPRVDIANVTEQDFRCYPLRGDSLAFYSRLYGRRLHLRRFFTLTAAEASAVICERLGIPPTRNPGPARPHHPTRPPGREPAGRPEPSRSPLALPPPGAQDLHPALLAQLG